MSNNGGCDACNTAEIKRFSLPSSRTGWTTHGSTISCTGSLLSAKIVHDGESYVSLIVVVVYFVGSLQLLLNCAYVIFFYFSFDCCLLHYLCFSCLLCVFCVNVTFVENYYKQRIPMYVARRQTNSFQK